MLDARPKVPPRQQARALATRKKLLDATVDSLIERGYANTSTTEVCKRAGVSQGALFKHFGNKTGLLTATIEHVFARLIIDYRAAFFAAVSTDEDRVSAAMRLLWATFTQPTLSAAFELYLAARTDLELTAALRPVLGQHRQNLRDEARLLFPEAAEHNPRFDQIINGIMATMQGGALMMMVLPEGDGAKDELAFIEDVVRRELDGLGQEVTS